MKENPNAASVPVILDTEGVSNGQDGALSEYAASESDEHYRALLDATVMMVDDEPTTIEILQTFLEDAGYRHFVTTSDSTRAMELVEGEKPDVVLLDVNMPQVTGFDILSAMRANSGFKHIPVLVLTSSDGADTKLQALQLGASDFLAKPVDPSELALRLRNTLAAKAYQDRLAYYDALTSLPNRRMFMERIEWELGKAKRYSRTGAILHIDLDRFKSINDTLGHSVGDALLKAVAERLSERVRSVDMVGRPGMEQARITLSRLGGDEFTILLPEIAHAEDVSLVARRILKSMEEPFEIMGRELFVTPSIGISVFPGDGMDPDNLLKHAEVAMYHCKQSGRNTYEFFSKEMNIRSMEHLGLEQRLRKALDRDELQLLYQPKVDVKTGQIVGAEALIRWNHPELGVVSPTKFIPMAEDTGLIVPMGEWILHTACKQDRAWHQAGLGPLRIAVNVSSLQFNDRGFLQMVQLVLQQSGLDAQHLTIEMTENMIMGNAKENIDLLYRIKELGPKLSIDDFGTGYSSLSYLKQFPLDELKIDRSFISEIQSATDDAPIVNAIIAMAKSLRFSLVAEGVETEQQLEFLKNTDCDLFQGFLFSRPITADKFIELVESMRSV